MMAMGVTVLGMLLGLQSRLIFYPERLPADFDFELQPGAEERIIETADGQRISALHYRAPAPSGVVLYFHGNAGSLRSWKAVAADIVPLGYDVFIVDYRGFGKSSGRITEAGLYEDGRAAYGALLALGYAGEDVILYGRSIGSGVATQLATEVSARALVLESPFTRLLDVAREQMPWALPQLTLRFHFNNAEKLAGVELPVLLLHGSRDELIGPHHSRALAGVLEERANLVIVEGGGHNDLPEFERYGQALHAFLSGLSAAKRSGASPL
ncbi:alpha/beta hydrolase [Lujinxingia litoralis]|uniref:Alpha/beta hydrolase n=2 Tax=Lujinxingia litoralis TaxID=2211119 RepID=A0A328CEB0_9DELT|nr:alpha/beta hydrolase [Lujinxingia litoralis]